MTLPRLPLTRTLVDALAAATQRPCGLDVLPRDERGEPAPLPYLVVDSLPGEFSGPPLADWHADAVWTYQVTAIGERADQVQWLADKTREAMAGRTPAGWHTELLVQGMRVIDRELTFDAAGDPVKDSRGSIVTYVQRVALTVSPA